MRLELGRERPWCTKKSKAKHSFWYLKNTKMVCVGKNQHFVIFEDYGTRTENEQRVIKVSLLPKDKLRDRVRVA